MTIVCVIGTPRSGSSLTAQILRLAGVYLGPEESMRPAGRLNPKGFWEPLQLIELNRRLLATLPRRGLDPPVLPPGWAGSEALEEIREDARSWLEGFAGQPLWGWKHAATTLVLPFWQELLPPMRYVICLRNPVDIAASQGALGKATLEEALAAWPKHMAAALAHTAGRPRILVAYEDYLDERRQTIERLWRFVGHTGPLGEREARRIEAAVDDSLLHQRTPLAETLGDARLPDDARFMYLTLELLRRADPEPWQLS